MKQISMRQKAVAFFAAALLALTCAAGISLASTQSAWADDSTTVTFEYMLNGAKKTTDVDLSLITDDTDLMYNFQRRNVNNVVRTDHAVLLDRAIRAALTQEGDLDAYGTVWTVGKQLKITTTTGDYNQFDAFTYENLTADGYFFPDTERDGAAAVGDPEPTATVIALNCTSAEIPEGYTALLTASDFELPLYTSQAPRLLWGWTANGPAAGTTGGNRLPSNITKITIS